MFSSSGREVVFLVAHHGRVDDSQQESRIVRCARSRRQRL